MERALKRMAEEEFDLLVLGGGIFGCGIARDAALRGLSVALVEKNDFGSGTTGASSRLIHGGLRYLAMLDWGLVREALQEQSILVRLVPHRLRHLLFCVPLYRDHPWTWRWGVPWGVALYRSLSLEAKAPWPHRWSSQGLLALEPALRTEGLLGAWGYMDVQEPFPERLCLDNLRDAWAHGACIANYAQAERLLTKGGRVWGALVRDRFSGQEMEVRARWVVNATGPWVDKVVATAHPRAPRRVRRTKGVHLVVPQFTERAFVLRARSDGRLFFVLPWNGFSLVGTTDTDWAGDQEAPIVEDADVDYLVRETRRYFPEAPLEDIRHTFVGLRSLVHREGKAPSAVTRRHLLVDHRSEGLEGLLSIVGGKMTTYRRLAQEVVDAVCQRLGKKAPCTTHRRPFLEDAEGLLRHLREMARPLGWDEALLERLAMLYGPGSLEVVRIALGRPSGQALKREAALPASFEAEVRYVLQAEMALTAEDVLFRRTMVGWSHPEAKRLLATGQMGPIPLKEPPKVA